MTWYVTFVAVVFGLHFWRRFRQRQAELNSPLAEHRVGMRFIGRSLMLEQAIKNNLGRVWLGNREWTVRGPDLPVGARVRVTGVDGSVLLVDRVST